MVQATVQYFLHRPLRVAVDLNWLFFRFYLPRQWISRGLAQAVSIEYVVHAHVSWQSKLVGVSFHLNNRVRTVHLLVKLLARSASSESLRRDVHFISYCKIGLSALLISLSSLPSLRLSNALLSDLSSELHCVVACFSIALSFLARHLLACSS
jgi:hypothetical protein